MHLCRRVTLAGRQRRATTPLRCQALETRRWRSHESYPSDSTASDKILPTGLFIETPENIVDATETPLTAEIATAENLIDAIETPLATETAIVASKASLSNQLLNTLSSKVGLSDRIKGLILVNIMTVIMSTSCVVVKDAQSMMDPFSFSALRFIIAALPFFPLMTTIKIDRETLLAGAEIGLWSTLSYLTQGMSLMTTDASRVAFLSALTVILVPLIVGLTGRGVTKLVWGSAAMALIGVGILSGTGLGGSTSMGDVLSLASAAFIALQVVRTEHYARILPMRRRISALGLSMSTVAAASSLIALSTHPDFVINCFHHLNTITPSSVMSWANHIPGRALLYTGFISTDVVLLIELVALNHVDSTDASIVYTMEPVLGAMWAYLLLGERWGANGWLGAALILGSSFAAQMYGSKSEETSL